MNAAHNIIHIALKCLREILCVYFTIYIIWHRYNVDLQYTMQPMLYAI